FALGLSKVFTTISNEPYAAPPHWYGFPTLRRTLTMTHPTFLDQAALTTLRGLEETRLNKQEILNEYTQRLTDIVSPAFRSRTILTIGNGAGSYAVEKL